MILTCPNCHNPVIGIALSHKSIVQETTSFNTVSSLWTCQICGIDIALSVSQLSKPREGWEESVKIKHAMTYCANLRCNMPITLNDARENKLCKSCQKLSPVEVRLR